MPYSTSMTRQSIRKISGPTRGYFEFPWKRTRGAITAYSYQRDATVYVDAGFVTDGVQHFKLVQQRKSAGAVVDNRHRRKNSPPRRTDGKAERQGKAKRDFTPRGIRLPWPRLRVPSSKDQPI